MGAWPEGANAKGALADLLWSTGRAREALPLANAALDAAPWSPDAMATLARTAVALGGCAAGLRLQERAAEVAEEGTLGAVRVSPGEQRRQLEELKARCARARIPARPWQAVEEPA